MPIKCNLCGNKNHKYILTIHSYPLVKCNNCGLVYIYHKFTYNELKKLYCGNSYTPYIKHLYKHEIEKIKFAYRDLIRIRKYKKQGNLLDVGCGCGTFIYIAKKVGFNVTLYTRLKSKKNIKIEKKENVNKTFQPNNFLLKILDIYKKLDLTPHGKSIEVIATKR